MVEDAYAQLAAEGYLEQPNRARPVVRAAALHTPPAGTSSPIRPLHDLSATTPDLSLFPRAAWARAERDVLRRVPDELLGYGSPLGPALFRQAVAARLGRTRGACTTADGVIATSGFTQAVDLVARTLVRNGARRVAVEDPGFDEQVATLGGAGLEVVPVPVDAAGLRVDLLPALGVDAVVVSPAHQFPTGAVLAAERRRELASWAVTNDRLLIEDDYDSEYRYDRQPVGALQGLAPDHVILLGTTAKMLAPALRIGWIVAPPHLVADISATRYSADSMPATLPLLAYAALADGGALDRHLRHTRKQYAARRAALLAGLAGRRVTGAAAGLHVVLELEPGRDEAVADVLTRDRVRVRTLASYTLDERNRRAGLVIGYGRLREAEIPQALAVLERALALSD